MAFFLNNLIIFSLLFFVSCSSKREFVPKTIQKESIHFVYNKVKIESINEDIITLSNNEAYKSNGEKIKLIQKGRVLEFENNETLQIQDLTLKFKNGKIQFPYEVVTASKKGDLIAYVLSNGDIGIYNLKIQKHIFKERYSGAITIDSRIPKPLFDKDTVLFFTLNGKIIVFNLPLNKFVREFIIGTSRDYGNIIDYRLNIDQFILLTHNEIVTIGNNGEKRKNRAIRGAIFHKDKIFLIKKNGEIEKLDRNLKTISKIKFPFAYFSSWGSYKDNLYLIESNGYIIKLNFTLDKYKIFESELDEERCFQSGKRFICDKKFFRLPL